MSKLDELIQKLCPNGVEYKSTTELSTGTFWLMPSTPHYIEKGIPYITSKNVKNGKISFEDVSYISEEDYIEMSRNRSIQSGDLLITMIGTIGETAFVEDFTEFYGQNLYLVRLNDKIINPKFYYYYFETQKEKLVSKKNPSSQGYIKAGSVNDLRIPVPPMEVQCEIVHILDQFTLLTAELTAELTARKQQYEYYKKELFNSIFVEKLVKLEDISNIITKQTGFDYSTTIKPSLITEKREGYLPFVQNKDFEGLSINFETDYYVPEKIANKFPRITLDTESLLISISGKIGNVGLFTNQQKAFIGGAICVCKLQKMVNAKYIMNYLMSSHGQKQLFMSVKAASHLIITVESIRNLTIPLPSLEEQQRIVDILDKFDTYCNDLTQGLPAEIELRKQQYEYYRDKLLSCKELK